MLFGSFCSHVGYRNSRPSSELVCCRFAMVLVHLTHPPKAAAAACPTSTERRLAAMFAFEVFVKVFGAVSNGEWRVTFVTFRTFEIDGSYLVVILLVPYVLPSGYVCAIDGFGAEPVIPFTFAS